MKKFILNAAFALFIAVAAHAQVGTGLFAGGSLGLSPINHYNFCNSTNFL